MTKMSLSKRLAIWALQTGFDDFPKEVVNTAKQCFLDTIGVALIASNSEAVQCVSRYALQEGGEPAALIWATGKRTSPALAALVNGTMAHAIDFDETNYSTIAHPSAVLIPAAMAMAELVNASGEELLSAFIVGHEIMCKLGLATNPWLYEKGWWSTSVFGVIGAAIVAARLLKLNRQQTQWALGLAVAQASGIHANIGSYAKPFKAGQAAQSGVVSALLAKQGLTSSDEIFEKKGGFFSVYVDDRYRSFTGLLGKPYDLLDPGVAFKQYPSCSGTHAAVDAAIHLARTHDLCWTKVSSVRCEVTPLVKMCLSYDSPLTTDQARFSMPFCIAVALQERDLAPQHFTDSRLQRDDIRACMLRVHMEVTPEFSGGKQGFCPDAPEATRVIIHTEAGATYSKLVRNARGTVQNPLSPENLVAKFRRCAGGVLSGERIDLCEKLSLTLESIEDIKALVRTLERC
jgi:2-methylcitrate dehydratase PrpD